MDQRQFEDRLRAAMEKAIIIVQSVVPVRDGDLLKSITLLATPTGYQIYMDMSKAPHMPYTEEKWISPRWNGRANPNEGWFKEAVELVFRLLRKELEGAGSFIGGG